MTEQESVAATANLMGIDPALLEDSEIYEEIKKRIGMTLEEIRAAEDADFEAAFPRLFNSFDEVKGEPCEVDNMTDEEIDRLLEEEEDDHGDEEQAADTPVSETESKTIEGGGPEIL